MSTITDLATPPRRRAPAKRRARSSRFSPSLIIAIVPLLGFTTTAARACACGCSVFDVGGGMLPQENDHGGRIFFEYWHSNQNTNWIGNSKGSAALNSDKNVTTSWYNVGFSYNVQPRLGHDGAAALCQPRLHHRRPIRRPAQCRPSIPRTVGDIEVMGMYTGFFKDMSTGVIFGLKLPTGTYTAAASTAIPRSDRAAPTSCSAASTAA